jgi:hypothetical protein
MGYAVLAAAPLGTANALTLLKRPPAVNRRSIPPLMRRQAPLEGRRLVLPRFGALRLVGEDLTASGRRESLVKSLTPHSALTSASGGTATATDLIVWL